MESPRALEDEVVKRPALFHRRREAARLLARDLTDLIVDGKQTARPPIRRFRRRFRFPLLRPSDDAVAQSHLDRLRAFRPRAEIDRLVPEFRLRGDPVGSRCVYGEKLHRLRPLARRFGDPEADRLRALRRPDKDRLDELDRARTLIRRAGSAGDEEHGAAQEDGPGQRRLAPHFRLTLPARSRSSHCRCNAARR